MKAQLRWTGHVIRMEDTRLPKIMLYGQLTHSSRGEGRPLLRYKDKLKANLASVGVKSDWEDLATQRTEWRALCNQHITDFEERRNKKMIADRTFRKNPPKPSESSLFVCDICNRVCKSKAGLVSHKRRHIISSSDNSSSSSSEVKCRICGKACKNERGLKVHLRVHK